MLKNKKILITHLVKDQITNLAKNKINEINPLRLEEFDILLFIKNKFFNEVYFKIKLVMETLFLNQYYRAVIIYIILFLLFQQLIEYLKHLKKLKYPTNFWSLMCFILEILKIIIILFVFILALLLIVGLFNFEIIKENSIIILELLVESFLGNGDLIILSSIKIEANKKRIENMIEIITKNNQVLQNGFEACLGENSKNLELLSTYKNMLQDYKNNIEVYHNRIEAYKLRNEDFINILHYIYQVGVDEKSMGNNRLFYFIKKLLDIFQMQSIEMSYKYDFSREDIIGLYFGKDQALPSLDIAEIMRFIKTKEEKK